MTGRVWRFLLRQPRVVLPGLLGAALIVGQVSWFWGLAALAYASWQASRLAATPELDRRLRLRSEKEHHGIRRRLSLAEEREVLAIDAYALKLERLGGPFALIEKTRDQMWQLIAQSESGEVAEALHRLRMSLPPLAPSATPRGNDRQAEAKTGELQHQLERELHILHATRKELEQVA